jgi:hypothetical protein
MRPTPAFAGQRPLTISACCRPLRRDAVVTCRPRRQQDEEHAAQQEQQQAHQQQAPNGRLPGVVRLLHDDLQRTAISPFVVI